MANGNWGGAASQFSEVEVDAIQLAVANGIATYAAGEIEKLAGIPNIAPLLALAGVNAYPRPFVIARSGGPTGDIVCAAAAFISTPAFTISNPSGNLMRIAHSSVGHGMGAGSDSKYLWVRTSAGVPSGIYQISTRASALQVDVDVGADNQSLIATTVVEEVSRLNSYFAVAVVAIPPGVLGANGELEISFAAQITGSTNWKYMNAFANTTAAGSGGTQFGGDAQTNTASHVGFNPPPARLINVGGVAVQRSFGAAEYQATTAPGSHTIDTDSAFYVAVVGKLSTLDESINLIAWRATVIPGL
jgi:hypothetical protein